MESMSGVPGRRREVDVVDAAAAAGWPLMGRRHVEAERLQTCSGAAEDEIDGLVQQFTFLKPCRQLEKQYVTRRNAHDQQCHAGNGSFRHGGEAMAAQGRGNAHDQQCHAGNGSFRHGGEGMAAQARDSRDQRRMEPRRDSRRKLEENSQCRLRESDAKPATGCEVLVTDAERGRRVRDNVRVHNHHDAARGVSSSELCVGEEADSISEAARRALARKLSRDGIELNSFVADATSSANVTSPRRSVSERFATRGRDYHRDVWRISSTRCSIHEKEAHIDLVAPAAAKFLVETTATTPLARQHYYYDASPPAVAVPFQWEDAPGRAKPATAARTSPDALQLPPRLAVPSRAGSSRERGVSAVVSHPLAGLFPCMTASSPSWSHHHRAREPPPIKPDTPPTKARKLNKSFSQPLTCTDASPTRKPRRLFSSELKPDPTSILHHSGRYSSSSRTYLSCDLDASTPRSKSSSSVSYESIGEDFVDSPRSETRARPGLLKLSCLRKSKSRSQRLCSPEAVWSYLQHLDSNNPNHEDATLLPVGGAPTSSGYLNSRGEPVAVSTEKATRLPYKMPSVEEQERTARSTAQRESDAAAEVSALEMLSPAVSIVASRRQQRGTARQPSGWVAPPKPHRRVQFILSVCKTLKRVLFRQQPRRSAIGTRLMYHDERAPTTFQFSKPN